MQTAGAAARGARGITQRIERWFPPPEVLLPKTAGIDISDSSVKWLVLVPSKNGYELGPWGEVALTPGIVEGGLVQDIDALAAALRGVAPQLGRATHAHAALPEEAGYVFSMTVPSAEDRSQVRTVIEFELDGRVPIPAASAVYDFSTVGPATEGGVEIAVTVFPTDVAESYAAAFERSGIELLSLEIEARSIARAVSASEQNEPATLLIDCGRARTGIALLKCGVPIFTSTVAVGGDSFLSAAEKALSLSREEAQRFGNEEGLFPKSGGTSAGTEAMIGAASALADEIARYYHYWDTRRNEHGGRETPIGAILMVGGSANVNGLVEYVSGRVQASVAHGNVWRHICSFDEYIPPIDRRQALEFATAIGLALRSV